MNSIDLTEATKTAEQTREILKDKGWCYWKCYNLDGDIIIVAADGFQLPMMNIKYPVYTMSEINELSNADINAIRIVHQAKKLMPGAVVKS